MPPPDYTGILKILYDWQTIIAGAAAIIGGWVAYIAGRLQARATREAADAQIAAINSASRTELRAYVLTSRAVVTNVAHGDGIPEAHVTIKNSGKTPAHNVISVNGFAADEYPSTPNLLISNDDFSTPALSRELLGPGDTTVSAVSLRTILTAQQKASLANGTGIIYAYGEIRYRDVYGRDQWTKYRYMIGGPVGIRGDQMAICQEGNEAT